jgi:hypothetical protein
MLRGRADMTFRNMSPAAQKCYTYASQHIAVAAGRGHGVVAADGSFVDWQE